MKNHMGLWMFIAFAVVSSVQSQTTTLASVTCSDSELLCGGSICYDPATQYCTEFGTVVQCIAACGNQCYNPSTQQCFNGTVCRLSEQLCVMKYYIGNGYGYRYEYNPPYYQCYDPSYQACFNNTLCNYPYQSCNQQCIGYNQVCVNNVTVCNVSNYYGYYQTDQIKLCSGTCYDSAIQQCVNGDVQCINNCSGVCYNSTTQQCFNGTVCRLNEQLCVTKYYVGNAYGYRYEYNQPYYQCYDPSYTACFNNTLCNYPQQTCNQQCIGYYQVCVNNVTVCNVSNYYWYYQADQIKLCNGACYDSFIQQCVNGAVQCIDNCSDLCYNSTTQQCFNGTVCGIDQQLCVVKYDASFGYEYNPPSYQCYYPSYTACFNNKLCQHPYRSCNQQCLGYYQVCVNNVTICNVTNYYGYYQTDQIKLCSDTCYDSGIQECVGGSVHCIRDPSTQKCIYNTTDPPQLPNSTSISTTIATSTSTVSITTTTSAPVSSTCCPAKQCTVDADCCARDTECQCFRHNNQDYGSCLNPYIQPICAEGCPVQEQCKIDTDCCKCQCAQVTVTNSNGTAVTRKQCVSR